MGRHRSDDSGDEYTKKSKRKKKRKARSRSRSSSNSESSRYSSSRLKKSRKKHKRSSRSRSRSADRRRPTDSPSRSADRRRPTDSRSRRSRSWSADRHTSGRARSHSKSPGQRSRRRSRSRSHSSRRHQSPSYSRSRRSRSRGRRSRSYSRERRSRSRSIERTSSRRSSADRRREASYTTASPSNVPVKALSISDQDSLSAEFLTPAEQAELRMRMALKAAAKADEQLRLRNALEDNNSNSLTALDRTDFSNSVAAIESDSFVASSFSSSRSNKVKEEASEPRLSHDDAIFGSLSVTGFTLKPDPDMRPINMDADSIIHPSLFCDPEEKMDRWIQKVVLMRRKLEGEAMM